MECGEKGQATWSIFSLYRRLKLKFYIVKLLYAIKKKIAKQPHLFQKLGFFLILAAFPYGKNGYLKKMYYY